MHVDLLNNVSYMDSLHQHGVIYFITYLIIYRLKFHVVYTIWVFNLHQCTKGISLRHLKESWEIEWCDKDIRLDYFYPLRHPMLLKYTSLSRIRLSFRSNSRVSLSWNFQMHPCSNTPLTCCVPQMCFILSKIIPAGNDGAFHAAQWWNFVLYKH